MADLETVSAAEFDKWLTPRAALIELSEVDHARFAINERVMAGRLKAAAQETQRYGYDPSLHYRIDPKLWQDHPPDYNCTLWDWGDWIVKVYRGGSSSTTIRMLGVRFDPVGIEEMKRAAGILPRTATPLAPSSDAAPDPSDDERTNLTAPEARRFCDFILAGNPNITVREAHKRALGFYYDRKVPRDWFWDILRTIQGPKSPGAPPGKRG